MRSFCGSEARSAASVLLYSWCSVVLICGPALCDETPAPAVVTSARDLLKQGKTDEAEQALLSAIQAGSAPVPVFLALAELYETTDRKERALQLYGHVLAHMDPKQAQAKDRAHRLFYEGRFPRELDPRYLGVGGVSFTADACRLSPEFHVSGDAQRSFAYSTSLIFPEEMARETRAPWIALPATGGQVASQMYNRVVYGLLGDAGTGTLRTRWVLGFPSATILNSAADYSDLATHVMHILLRAHVYVQEYLAFDRVPEEGGLLRAFLTEEGPTGAEQSGDRIFIYDVDTEREPLEWLREILHEAGHLYLPRIGPFDVGERWASGDLGERLLLGYLMEEAGTTTGDPWPGGLARAAFDGLWRPCSDAAMSYLADRCRLPLSAWLNTDPEAFTGKDAAERFCAFSLWVQAAHGRAVLASALHAAQGSAPTDFLTAYKAVVARRLDRGDPLWVDAGALNLVASKLAQPPREGALRRELVVLGQGGTAAFRVWLPGGPLVVLPRVGQETTARLTLKFDATQAFIAEPGAILDLGVVREGWHELILTCGPPGPVELLGLQFSRPASAVEGAPQ